MTIGKKRQLLLLSIALIPMLIVGFVYRKAMHKLGGPLASDTRETLTEDASCRLRTAVSNYSQLIDRDMRTVRRAVEAQAAAVEARLAAAPPAEARIILASEYDDKTNPPSKMIVSDTRLKLGADGKQSPISISYDDQVYFLARGADKQAAAADMARLSTMPQEYRRIHDANSTLMYWQYTSLESGFHTSYPGHGGYPDDYDPRVRQWYLGAKAAGRLSWYLLPDVSTRSVALTASMPVRRPDGTLAGVTAIDVPLTAILDLLVLPEAWRSNAETMFVSPHAAGDNTDKQLMIVLQKSYNRSRRDWRTPPAMELLTSSDTNELAAMTRDISTGKSAVRRMKYKGVDSLWAYAESNSDRANVVALAIVPYDKIISQALAAQERVLDETGGALQLVGAVMLAVLAIVAASAFASARRLTRPVLALSDAAGKLADGDFNTSVEINTGDELQTLGEVFNNMGPKLREHEKMKQSLELAMEIQQHLLPQRSPTLNEFDIAGRSIYCDETGGDYYDFIELTELSPGRLGVALGDVSGHGIGAALLMAAARGVLRSHACGHGADLGRLFETINLHLVRDTRDAQFMTLFYAVIDAETRSLVWTSGGHDPALWLRNSDRGIQELPNTGIPLGILDDAEYSQAGPIELDPGDIVLVGTDGIWEARNTDGEMFGKDRLRELLTDSADKSAAEIHDTIVDAVHCYRQAQPQEDDVTLVVIKAL